MGSRIRNDSRDVCSGRFVPAFQERPSDFEATFVRVGRIGCEEEFGVGRLTVNRWLIEVGKERMIELRAQFVRRKEAERHEHNRLNRRDMGKILRAAFPAPEAPPELARRAAQHLRIRANGGFAVSPMMSGGWMVGLKRVTTDELIEMAKARGFSPSLTGDDQSKR